MSSPVGFAGGVTVIAAAEFSLLSVSTTGFEGAADGIGFDGRYLRSKGLLVWATTAEKIPRKKKANSNRRMGAKVRSEGQRAKGGL